MFKRKEETDYADDPNPAPAWAKYAVVVAVLAVCFALLQMSLNYGETGTVHRIEQRSPPAPPEVEATTADDGLARQREMLKLARTGDPDAAYWLGVWYAQDAKDPHTSFKWMQAAALGGVPEAVLGLAKLYEVGSGRRPDMIRSAAWYQIAQEVGAIDRRTLRRWQGWMRDVDLKKAEQVASIHRHEVLTNAGRRYAAFGAAAARIAPPFRNPQP